jgi:hypothetical protein
VFSRFLLLPLLWTLSGCADRPPTLISGSLTFTKQQRHYENSDDFREKLGKKLFDYERARPGFKPKRLTQKDAPRPLSPLIAKKVFSKQEAGELKRAGIKSYNIFWEDYWRGRTYWLQFYYRNGNMFSFDVHTNIKNNAVIYD